ncbi:MAG: hypothetical protein F9K48_07765 [Candidatus Brocadia sp.]|nr:MAG: hypothetical protein F9K48_07765 [Candidatus Brocadia sp.]
MNYDPFPSHIISQILSWVAAIPLIIAIFATFFHFFLKKKEFPRFLTVWLGICLLVFSPARYMVFQMAGGFSYPFQSFTALLCTSILVTYVPIVFGILYAIGVGLPLFVSLLIFAKDTAIKKWKLAMWALVLPILFCIGSFLFYKVLPLAAWSIRWVNPSDVIKATNGPTFYIYKYFAMMGTPHSMPSYFEKTPGRVDDFLRCHVASLYLSRKGENYFIKKQYPEIYEGLNREY